MFSAFKFSNLWIVLLGGFTVIAYAADSSLPEQTFVAPPLAETPLSVTSPVICSGIVNLATDLQFNALL